MYRNMVTSVVAILILLVGLPSPAQEPATAPGEAVSGCHAITGLVVDRETGLPLEGVEVLIDSVRFARTDADGRFELCAGTPDSVTLGLRLEGRREQELRARSGEELTITLDSAGPARFADEVTVVGQAVRPVEPMREVTPEAVAAMPGAGEDVLQTLRALPGVVSADDWSSRLYVRGGRPDQNGIYIDGISVYDPYRLFGLTSLFNPETVGSIAFYPGGFDVRYGDRLSAVIAVENRDGTRNRPFGGSASIAMTHTNLVGECRSSAERPSSWLVSARRTSCDLALEATGDTDSSFPSFADAQARLLFEPSPGNRFTVTLLGYDEGTDLAENGEPSFGNVDNRIEVLDDQKGFIAGARGEHRLGDKARVDYVLAATSNQQSSDIFFTEGETGFETAYVQELTGDVFSLRSSLEVYLGRHTMLGGVEAAHSESEVDFRFRTEDPRIPIPPSLLDFEEAQDFRRYAVFAQDTWQLTPRLALKGGARWDQSTLSDSSTLSPRASLRYEPSPAWELWTAWGIYTQFASYEALQGDGYFLDLRGIKELGLKPERAEHWLVGGSHVSPRGFKITLDLYYKDLEDILQSGEYLEEVLVLDDQDVARPYLREQPSFIPENTRSGFARGAELSFTILERSDRPIYGMVSYAFAQARTRDEDGWLWEPWDRRQTLTLVGGWRIAARWEVGLRWRYASGFPFTPVSNVIRVVEDVDGDGIYDPEAGDFYTHQRDEPHEVEYSERLPDYHRLDLRVQYSRRYSRVSASYYLDIINAYAQDNVIGWEYNEDYTEREAITGMPLVPSVGVKVVF